MKRLTIALLIACTGTLLLFFGATVALFYRNLDNAAQNSRSRMLLLAGYIASVAERSPSAGTGRDSLDQWLDELTKASGLERTVIVDSSGRVFLSSRSILRRGDRIAPLLVDPPGYDSARTTGSPHFSPVEKIEGVFFQSLYYPCTFDNLPCMVILESDQHYYKAIERFKSNLTVASFLLAVAIVILILCLIIIRRKMETAIARSNHQERLAFLGRASAELAHEIKNPLGIIKSSIDVLRRKYDPSATQQAFDFVSDEVMRLSRLIDGMLGFSRERELAKTPFEVLSLVSASLDSFHHEHPGTQCELALPENVIFIGDADAFRQVTDNIVRNAFTAAGDKGTVSVRFEVRGNEGRLLFLDSGPGIPEKIKKTLFDPFVTGKKTGTGLGLAIVKALCERSGWKIDTRTDAGKTCFELIVPEKLWRKS